MILFLKNMMFTLIVPGTVAVLVPFSISENSMVNSHWFLVFGYLFLLVGISIYCWCLWDFASFGRATPAPIDAPKYLVVRGLYHYSRNPMYIGVLSVILSWFFLLSDFYILVYCACIAACFYLLVVLYEEPILENLFGLEYAEYRTSVNRWLPKIE